MVSHFPSVREISSQINGRLVPKMRARLKKGIAPNQGYIQFSLELDMEVKWLPFCSFRSTGNESTFVEFE